MRRRLIEEQLPLTEVNEASAREKALRHGHISTMHLWWARRPLAMSRAVVYGTLLPDPDDEAERRLVLRELANATEFEAVGLGFVMDRLRARLRAAYPDTPPTVLDCFAGGGAIPLEALRLGCDVTALDLNPVAHLIERCVLEFPQRFGERDAYGGSSLASDFVRWARWVRARMEPRLARVFPADAHGRRPAAYFWARTIRCPNLACAAEIPLLKDRWLARNSRNVAWLALAAEPGRIACAVRTDPPGEADDPSLGTVRASSVTCPACATSVRDTAVRAYGQQVGFGRQLTAVLNIDGAKRRRTYRDPQPEEVAGAERLATKLLDQLEETPDGSSPLPDETIAKSQSRRFTNLVYGIDTFRGLFNDRQLYVLGTFCEAVRAAHTEMLDDGMDPERARAVATYLGLAVDRVADRNSSFCTWDWRAINVRNTFPQQAIRMAWNYVEIDPLANISGSWDSAIRWIELAIRHCADIGRLPASVLRGNAQALPFPDGSFDAVVVDPPYYDAFQYGDLSDFFYVWLKRSIGHLYPTLFAAPFTPKQQEIIESRAQPQSPEFISHDEFERRLQRALGELARVVKPDGMVSIVFGHTDVVAWERLLRALRVAGLIVTTSWPMRSEMINRTTAHRSAVLGSSVVLVCRPQHAAEEGFYDDVVRELEQRVTERLATFDGMGLVGADYFVSAVGPAFEVFANYKRVVRLSGTVVEIPDLMVLARQTVARYALRKLLRHEHLAALDDQTLFYLAWRWAYGVDAIPDNEAIKLAQAFNVDLYDPQGFVRKAGKTFTALGPLEREQQRLRPSPPLIDVIHMACRLWETGRRDALAELLADTGAGGDPRFWDVVQALHQILPNGTRERSILFDLDMGRGSLDGLAARSMTAKQPSLPTPERP